MRKREVICPKCGDIVGIVISYILKPKSGKKLMNCHECKSRVRFDYLTEETKIIES